MGEIWKRMTEIQSQNRSSILATIRQNHDKDTYEYALGLYNKITQLGIEIESRQKEILEYYEELSRLVDTKVEK